MKSVENLDQTRKQIAEHQVLSDVEYFQLEPKQLDFKFDAIVLLKSVLRGLKDFNITDYLINEGFVIYIGSYADIKQWKFDLVFETTTDTSENLYLLRPPYEISSNCAAIQVFNDKFDWVEDLKNELNNEKNETVFLYTQKEEYSGMVGLLNCVLKEAPQSRGILIEKDKENEKITFDINNNFIRDQLNKNLTMNVLRNGRWGTFIHFPFVYEEKKAVTDAGFKIKTIGDLSSLSWEELPPKS